MKTYNEAYNLVDKSNVAAQARHIGDTTPEDAYLEAVQCYVLALTLEVEDLRGQVSRLQKALKSMVNEIRIEDKTMNTYTKFNIIANQIEDSLNGSN